MFKNCQFTKAGITSKLGRVLQADRCIGDIRFSLTTTWDIVRQRHVKSFLSIHPHSNKTEPCMEAGTLPKKVICYNIKVKCYN